MQVFQSLSSIFSSNPDSTRPKTMATFRLIVVLVCVYLTMHHAAGRYSSVDYQSDARDQDEVSLLHADSDYKRLALEMRKLRAELRVVRQNCEAIVGDVARVSDLSLRETNERLAIVKALAETAALGLKQSTSLWDSNFSNIQALRTEFREESSSTSRKLSEIQSNLGSKLASVKNECDLSIQSLNASIQTVVNDMNLCKLTNESAVVKRLVLGIDSLNETLINHMPGLKEASQGRETDFGVNVPFTTLQLVQWSSKLPRAMAYSSAGYDGTASIYILGGTDTHTRTDKVLKYSVQSGNLETTITFRQLSHGSAIMDGEHFVYFGGYSVRYESEIYAMRPTNAVYSLIGSLPVKADEMGVAWDSSSRTAYLFGGGTSREYLDQIISHSMATNQTTPVGWLPQKRKCIAAAWDSNRRVAHLFSGNDTWQFAPPSTVSSYRPLPYTLAQPCSVYASANDHVYVFGGGKLIKYNPASHTSILMEVRMWPTHLQGAACVYVPKQHRMYIFGGYGNYGFGENQKHRDEISFIDLD